MAVYQADNAKWLREAIESMTEQSYTDFLFVIVADGPVPQQITRLLEDVASKDDRVIIASNSHNVGLASSMNSVADFGMQFNPSFFIRMDADDISLPKRLKIQFNFMDSHPEVGMCGTLNKGLDNNKVGVSKYPEDHDSICCMLLFQNVFDHSTLMMSKKKLFEYRLKYDDSIKYAQDYELISRAARFFPLTNIQQVLVFSRTHPDQIANRYHKSQKSVTRLVQERQLNELGINPGENYLDLHGNTVTLRLPPSKKMILDTANWLKIIKSANQTESIMLN